MNHLTTAPPGVVFICPHFGRLPVTNMFDVDQEETTDLAQVCFVEGPLPDGRWYVTDVKNGELVREGLS
jgi:hypothetical protein